MLVDASYFYGPTEIAQVSNAVVQASINRYIEQYEPEVLEYLMGPELYAGYSEGIEAATPEEKWTDIRDGKTYTNRAGQSVTWKGLAFTRGTVKKSLVANYVYFKYRKYNATQTTGTGEKNAKAQNAKPASPRRKMVDAWNEMVEWNAELVEFLLSHDDVYPEFLTYYGNRKLDYLLTKLNPLF